MKPWDIPKITKESGKRQVNGRDERGDRLVQPGAGQGIRPRPLGTPVFKCSLHRALDRDRLRRD